MSNDVSPLPSFRDLALIEPLLKALDDVGYKTPSPIQAQVIPHMLQGKDVLGQAQTGKVNSGVCTAHLSRIDLRQKDPQVLGPGTDPRTCHPGSRGVSALCGAFKGLSCSAYLRRAGL